MDYRNVIYTRSHSLYFMIKEANATVIVSDMNKSIQFYTDTLGLQLKLRMGNGWAEVTVPGLTIGLHPTVREHGPKPGNSESLSIGFIVDNLEKDMAALKNKGVVFSPNIIEDGPVKIAFFTDPDKNPLYLCEVHEQNRAG
jgi:catechol 2,3-dioxygenase-like lactoylglutathione lyase family enzyme